MVRRVGQPRVVGKAACFKVSLAPSGLAHQHEAAGRQVGVVADEADEDCVLRPKRVDASREQRKDGGLVPGLGDTLGDRGDALGVVGRRHELRQRLCLRVRWRRCFARVRRRRAGG